MLSIPLEAAFARYAHSLITGTSLHSFNLSENVDGGQDKQIDTLTIDQDGDEATVFIMQYTTAESFGSNKLIQMKNGLEWIFNKSKAEIATLSNVKFQDKIFEYRSIQNTLGPSNMRINVGFVVLGSTSEISAEYKQEKNSILAAYDNGTFSEFSFKSWGVDELIQRINILEKNERRIDADIKIDGPVRSQAA